MYRLALITVSLLSTALPTAALTASDAPATYIMQVSSNLKCDRLDIELISQKSNTSQYIRFGTGAFAATELPAGSYTFGDVTCTKENEDISYDFLKDKIAPIEVSAGQAYFGGRMMFKQASSVQANDAPEALNSCTFIRSNARGESDNACQDGTGTDGSAPISSKIEVFLPKVLESEVAAVRTAMSATEEELIYLPLKV
jgi:hypothetical protein